MALIESVAHERMRAKLEEYFPWLGTDEPISAANAVDCLNTLYEDLGGVVREGILIDDYQNDDDLDDDDLDDDDLDLDDDDGDNEFDNDDDDDDDDFDSDEDIDVDAEEEKSF